MSDNSSIEWTNSTWNPITGCTPISAGCTHCYAKRMSVRLAGRFGYPKENPFTPGIEHIGEWTKPMGWRKPRKIFVCSMGDLFHDAVTSNQIIKVLDFCRQSSQHTFQILTKRPERCCSFDFPSNVWLGTTVEVYSAFGRITHLSNTNARVRFLSCEPLLSPLDLQRLLTNNIHWVVVGAETGPNKRPMNLDWARQIRDDCATANIPFFFKKDSDGQGTLDGIAYHNFPKVQNV